MRVGLFDSTIFRVFVFVLLAVPRRSEIRDLAALL